MWKKEGSLHSSADPCTSKLLLSSVFNLATKILFLMKLELKRVLVKYLHFVELFKTT